MRALFILAWLIISALVIWYMIGQNTGDQLEPVKSSLSSDIEVIDEVSGSIYTGNNNDNVKIDSTSSQSLDATQQDDNSVEDEQILGESLQQNSNAKFPFLEVAYIEFNQNKVTLPPNKVFEKYLDSIANIIQQEDLVVELVGHADKSLSNKRNNFEVGKQRAEFIREALLKRNVPADKISVESKGATEPRIDDITHEANEKNRRVELFLKPNN